MLIKKLPNNNLSGNKKNEKKSYKYKKGEIMLYKAMEIDEIFNDKDSAHEIIDILDNNGSHLKLVSLKKNEGFDSHMSHTNVCVYLVEGELEFTFDESTVCGCNICSEIASDNKNRKEHIYKIKKGQLFLFEKDVMHSLKAAKNSKFLLIKI